MRQVKTSPMKLNLVAKLVSTPHTCLYVCLNASSLLHADQGNEYLWCSSTDEILWKESSEFCWDGKQYL